MDLKLKGVWTAPGYRDLTLELVDAKTGQRHDLHISATEIQRLVNGCADAVKQIGFEPPIDWDLFRAQIYWPVVTPWKVGPSPAKTEPR